MNKPSLLKWLHNLALVLWFLPLLAQLPARAQAPASIMGDTFQVQISYGTFPFANSGYFLLLPASSGNTFQIVNISGVTNRSGTYTYSPSLANGSISLNETGFGDVVGGFNFLTATSGTYSVGAGGGVQYGNFEMLSASAPASIAGQTLSCSVTAGLAPFASNGFFTIKVSSSGTNYTIAGDGAATASSSGICSYSKVNTSTGKVQVRDSILGTFSAYLSFSNSAAGGFSFTQPSSGGAQAGSFTLFTSPIPASVSITSPTNGMNVTMANFTITGTARATATVTNVSYSLNDSGWNPASTTNNWAKWSANVVLNPGTNIIKAYAVDSHGHDSPTNTATFFYAVKAPLTVTLYGTKGATSITNGTLLDLGRSYSMTATAAPGCLFTGWTGSTNITNATFHFIMQSNLAYTADFEDVQKPTLSITTPTNGMTVTTTAFTMKGTAHDNIGVTSVSYSLNGAGPQTANTSNNWASWNAVLALTPGTNYVTAYSTDAANNNSISHNVTFFYLLKAPLAVMSSGGKGATSIGNGALLALGRSYSLTATAAPGFKFIGWSGGTNVTNATIHFTMVSNLAFTANYEDIAPPTVSITAPSAGQHLTNGNFLIMGKASDNMAVASVSYQLNGGGWNAASTLNNWSNWMAAVVLPPGSNNVMAIAMDTSSNVSSTASVNFTYTVPPDWAPASVAGLRAKVTSDTNGPFSMFFGPSTFSQSSTVSGKLAAAGDYSYDKLGTNTAELTVVYTLPPPVANLTNTINLMFDAFDSGTYSNLDTGDNGTFSLSPASNLALASLAGLTINATNASQADGATFTLSSSTFSQNDSGGNVYAGTYTYQKYSPAAGMFVSTYISPPNKAGEVSYVQFVFLTATSGDFFLMSFDSIGDLKANTQGTFTTSP